MPQCGEGSKAAVRASKIRQGFKNPLRSSLRSSAVAVVCRRSFFVYLSSLAHAPRHRHPALHFNAAHRVFNPSFSDAENEATFGKCNNPNWHGHNYTLDVSVEGEIDERTGYVMDLAKLSDIVEREVVDKVDHRNFNLDVPFMEGRDSDVGEHHRRVLEDSRAGGQRRRNSKRLVLWETENNYVEYYRTI